MNDYFLRLKLLLRDRVAVICYIIVCVVILSVLAGLNIHSEERSAVPIGLVTEDDSAEALALERRIIEEPALYTYTGDFDHLNDLLLDGYINCIFVIRQGYGDAVKRGEPAEVVSITAAEDDRISSIISDIVAGCMMYEICLDKAFVRYMKLEPPEGAAKLDFAAFADHMETLATSEEFAFTFDMHYVDASEPVLTETDITNGMIYRQMIAGMLAMLLMLVCFCACNMFAQEAENGIRRRRGAVRGHIYPGMAGDILAILTYSLPVNILISVMFASTAGAAGSLRLFGLDIVFTLLCCIMYYIFAGLCRGVFAYQFVGTLSVVLLGVTGFVSVFAGLLGTGSFAATPVAAYINAFIRLVLRS